MEDSLALVLNVLAVAAVAAAAFFFFRLFQKIKAGQSTHSQTLNRAALGALALLAAFGLYGTGQFLTTAIIEPVGDVAFESRRGSLPNRIARDIQQDNTQDQTPTQQESRSQTQDAATPTQHADQPTDTDQSAQLHTTAWTTSTGPLASASRTQRVIVHTADITIVVTDIPDTVRRIEDLAIAHGGWLVSATQDSRHAGAIAIRVPAASLRQAIEQIVSTSVKIDHLNLTSEDVTDDFVDTQSSLKALTTTEQNYLDLLAQAQSIQENLQVRELLQQTQREIETLKGRLNYLSQVSAFSLITVTLRLAPAPMTVDAGQDITIQTGQPAQLDAILSPPPGKHDYSYTWDPGDGSTPRTGHQTAIIPGAGGNRSTNPVAHIYDREGRYIAEITAKTAGQTGVAEGTDTLMVTVKTVPSINVSIPVDIVVATEREQVTITANFTKPAELTDYTYQWYFGDDSPTIMGTVPQGINQVTASHTYDVPTDNGPRKGQFTISALSEAGKVSSTATFNVYVGLNKGIIAGNWDVGATFKTAARSIFAVLSILLTLSIWLLTFSPLIAIVAAAIYLIRRKGWLRPSPTPSPSPPAPQTSP